MLTLILELEHVQSQPNTNFDGRFLKFFGLVCVYYVFRPQLNLTAWYLKSRVKETTQSSTFNSNIPEV